MEPWVIAGLGNPGEQYKGTRHNIGFDVVEKIQNTYEFSSSTLQKKVLVSKGKIDTIPVYLCRPMAYMNLSGQALAPFLHFYKIPLHHFIVIHDDLDLPCGEVRLKQGGSSGGHNGLRNIDQMIGKEYWRIRIGIDHPGIREIVSNYVISRFFQAQQEKVDQAIEPIIDNIDFLLQEQIEKFKQALKEHS